MPWGEILVRAFFCNIMVCLAVNCGRWATSVADWFFACLMPVACFVTCGFEHSIADMFYMLLGLFNGGVDAVGVIYVLAVSVAGNVIGGTAYAVLGYERRK
jgi:formate/nitrite transporter FocA (FNT family)